MTNKNIFVIIVTYKGKLWYDRCFSSLRTSELPVHTVVIDNASNDGTVQYIRDNYPEIHVIASDINLGFGQGNNKGIRYALDNGADYVFLLNQDAWIEPNTISELFRIHQENKAYGILSPINLNATNKAILSGFLAIISDYRNVDKNWINDLYFDRLKDVYEIKSVNASAWMLPRKTLEIVGGFDPIFFHYGEDDNYLQRVYFHNFKVGICPKIKIIHDAEVSSQSKKDIQQKDLYKRIVLLDCTNINKDGAVFLYIKKQIKYLIKSFICLKYTRFINEYKKLYFTIVNRKRIIRSRKQNKLRTSSWL